MRSLTTHFLFLMIFYTEKIWYIQKFYYLYTHNHKDNDMEKIIGKYKIKISHDDLAMNPRTEMDNLGTFFMFHSSYSFGDENTVINKNHYGDWGELEQGIRKKFDVAVLLPVYLLDHSGLTISTTPFECRFDSMQIGYIFATKDKIRECFLIKNVTKKIKELAENNLIGEIDTFNSYLNGETYCYDIYEGENHLDACGGYYDEETCMEEAETIIKSYQLIDYVNDKLKHFTVNEFLEDINIRLEYLNTNPTKYERNITFFGLVKEYLNLKHAPHADK